MKGVVDPPRSAVHRLWIGLLRTAHSMIKDVLWCDPSDYHSGQGMGDGSWGGRWWAGAVSTRTLGFLLITCRDLSHPPKCTACQLKAADKRKAGKVGLWATQTHPDPFWSSFSAWALIRRVLLHINALRFRLEGNLFVRISARRLWCHAALLLHNKLTLRRMRWGISGVQCPPPGDLSM